MKLTLKKSGGIFDIENLKNEIDNLEKKTFEADFWNSENSQEILKTISAKKKLLEEYSSLNGLFEDVSTIIEFIEMGDNSFENELEQKAQDLKNEIDNFKTKLVERHIPTSKMLKCEKNMHFRIAEIFTVLNKYTITELIMMG